MATDQHFSFKFFPQNAFVSSQGWIVTPYPYEIELGIPRNPNDNARK